MKSYLGKYVYLDQTGRAYHKDNIYAAFPALLDAARNALEYIAQLQGEINALTNTPNDADPSEPPDPVTDALVNAIAAAE